MLTINRREEGFTLIELLVVIIIIGILAAIAIPLFLDQRKLAVDASVKSDVRNTLANIKTWQANDANANKAIANTGDFISAANGGKVAQSPGNSIGISISSTGDATVCGYDASGKTYLSDSAAYVFSPSTGQFTTGSCATGSTTGGVAATGGSSSGGAASGVLTYTAEADDPNASVWQDVRASEGPGSMAGGSGAYYSFYTKSLNHGGSGSIAAPLSAYVTGSIPLVAGKQYKMSWYVYIKSSSTTSYISIRGNLGSQLDATASNRNQWLYQEQTITAPNGTDRNIQWIVYPYNSFSQYQTNNTREYVYFDDITFTPVN